MKERERGREESGKAFVIKTKSKQVRLAASKINRKYIIHLIGDQLILSPLHLEADIN